MLDYLPVLLAVLALTATGYINFARPAWKRRKAALASAAQPEPSAEPRTPRDLDRPYPRPDRRRRRLDSVCPVCGMDDLRQMIPDDLGKVLGWPAHRSCAEWLGDWKPPGVPPPRRVPTGSVIPERSIAVKGNLTGIASTGNGTVSYLGGTAITIGAIPDGSYPIITAGDLEAAAGLMARGLASADEIRERITSTFGVPPPDIGATTGWQRHQCKCGMEFQGAGRDVGRSLEVHRTSGQCEQRLRSRKAAEPIVREWCTCGQMFTGTREDVAGFLHCHQRSGMCPHAVNWRR